METSAYANFNFSLFAKSKLSAKVADGMTTPPRLLLFVTRIDGAAKVGQARANGRTGLDDQANGRAVY